MSNTNAISLSRQKSLAEQFRDVRAMTNELCVPLQPEDFVVQPVDEVSPPKWHLAHTTWFFENFILKANREYKVFDDDYHFLFNSYYETEGDRWARSKRGVLSRPWVNEILAYRKYVEDHLLNQLKEEEWNEERLDILEIGIHHEQQHQELLLYDVKNILGVNPLYPVYRNDHSTAFQVDLSVNFCRVKEGIYSIGHNESGFHFDNELGQHRVFLESFQIMDRLITNGEYLEFIIAGGYKDFRFWLMEGYEWVKENNIVAPKYWWEEKGEWHAFTLGGKKPLNLDEPVSHLSYYEADAFAKWKGMRLPTEFEWEVACKTFEEKIPKEANFLNSRMLKPLPRKKEHSQFYGDLWEWTSSAYSPYPFYKAPEGAIGEYNGKFMINQMVLRGGSYATMKDHIRPTYRNFFHPNMRWQFSGLRLAENI